MSDVVDRANDQYSIWLGYHLKWMQASADVSANAHLDAESITDCIECDEPIGEKRKQALPSAVLCIACARSLETPSTSPQSSKQAGGGLKALNKEGQR